MSNDFYKLFLKIITVSLFMLASGMAFAGFAIKATPTGSPGNLTLNVNVQTDQSILGQPGSFFVAAELNGAWYYPTATGWKLWYRSNPLPPYLTTTLQATNNFTPIQNMDVTSYAGAKIYAGYGSSMSSMMANGTWNLVYVVPNTAPFANFYVWASTGPQSYLSGATVTVKDATGAVVGSAATNKRGVARFRLPTPTAAQLPLQINASGGVAKGANFLGTLSAVAGTIGQQALNPVIFLDLISTSATNLWKRGYVYSDAVTAVRTSLGIGKGAPVDVLRFKNSHVDNAKLRLAVLGSGGFDNYIKKVALSAASGETISGLQPSRATDSFTSRSFSAASNADAAASSSSSANATYASSPVCTASTYNATTTAPSQFSIENIGSIATSVLLAAVGVPKAANDGITGMLMSLAFPSSSPTDPVINAINNMVTELDCISQQISNLSEQVTVGQFTQDMNNALDCASQISLPWTNYQAIVSNACTATNPSANCDAINYSNPNLYVAGQSSGLISQMSNVVSNCGTTISNNIFGTGGTNGLAAAWPELNSYYQNQGSWYTQAQSQGLQSFLSYWSSILYQQFVMGNEANNFFGQTQLAVNNSGTAQNGSSACISGASANSYCVQQSQIQYAYPGDLYSDEVGLFSGAWTGYSVIAFPAGGAVGQGQLGMNANYLGGLYVQSMQQTGSWSYPASTLTTSAINAYASEGINPGNQPSAVETFSNPQAPHSLAVSSSNVSALQSSGPNGQSMFQFFLSALQQGNAAAWNAYSPSQVAYYTSDNVTTGSGTYIDPAGCIACPIPVTTKFGNFNGNISTTVNCQLQGSTTYQGKVYTWPNNCYVDQTTSAPATPIMGVFLGRSWWPAMTIASAYTSSTIPTTPYSVPTAPGLISVATGSSSGQIAVTFTPSISTGPTSSAIIGYLASCYTSTPNGQSTVTGYGSASPVTVGGLTIGSTYTCQVQAQNSGGYSAASSSANAAPAPFPPVVPGAPTLTSLTSSIPTNSTAASVTLQFTPPTSGGAPTGYIGVCVGSDSVFAATSASSPISIPVPPAEALTCLVIAQNVYGEGSYSNYSDTTSPANPYYVSTAVPGVPTLTSLTATLPANATTPSLALQFTPPTSGGAPTSYIGECYNTSTGVNYNVISSNSPISIPVVSGTYTCSVYAQNLGGTYYGSNTLTTTTP